MVTVPRMGNFGKHLLSEWMLDPSVTYLNHGTVGAPPRRVLQAQRELSDRIEHQPAQFMLRELADIHADGTWTGAPPHLRAAAALVGEFVGAAAEDLVFVDNITAGANAVLRSFPFVAGDEILVTNLGYGGVTNIAHYVARTTGATVRSIELPWPGAAPHEFVDAIAAGIGPHTRLMIVDHITAETALVLPLAEIIAACHDRGVLVLVDGAHAPGGIPIDIASYGADWYTANLHKWAWAPRSCGILWAAPQHHGTLHPTVISWGLDHGITAEFDLLGTRDPTPFLIAPFAIAMMREFGLAEIYTYNHALAWWAGQHLAQRWGTTFATPEAMIGSMVNVTLPRALADADAASVRARLGDVGIEVPVFAHPHGLTLRVSAQIYVGRDDIDRLGDAVLAMAAEMTSSSGAGLPTK